METILNISNIERVIVHEKKINTSVFFLPEKKGWFGRIKRKSGFYTNYGFSGVESCKIPDDCYSENQEVFYHPYIVFYLVSGKTHTVYYKDKSNFEIKLNQVKAEMYNKIIIS